MVLLSRCERAINAQRILSTYSGGHISAAIRKRGFLCVATWSTRKHTRKMTTRRRWSSGTRKNKFPQGLRGQM